jgi:hypothetical protein
VGPAEWGKVMYWSYKMSSPLLTRLARLFF